MEKADTFQAWTKQHELSDSTVEVLKENGFDSVQSCELLNGSMIQKHFAKSLTLGQTLLLQKAVDYLSKAPAGADATEDYQTTVPPKESSAETPPANPVDLASPAPVLDTMLKQPEGLDAAALLSILSMNQPAAKTSPIDNGKGLIFDPFMFSDHKACK